MVANLTQADQVRPFLLGSSESKIEQRPRAKQENEQVTEIGKPDPPAVAFDYWPFQEQRARPRVADQGQRVSAR